MALNLIKAGHALVVHDVRREAAREHLEKGAKWASSDEGGGPRATELIPDPSLPGPADGEAVALGDPTVCWRGLSPAASTPICRPTPPP
jgi:3-hydroxyisobutyrate dehydrogenase-like beta-hydroxyacid dehydrogenase